MSSQTPAGDGPVPPTPNPGPAGTAPADAPPGSTTAHALGFFQSVRGIGLYRSDDRWIGGVAGGIAARFGVDPLLVRGILFVTLLLGGFGLVLYAVAWALLPEQRDGRIHLEGLVLGRPDVALLGSLGMFVVGIGRGAWLDGPMRVPGWVQGVFWLGATLLVVVLVATMLSRRTPPPPVPPMPPSAHPQPAPQPYHYAQQPPRPTYYAPPPPPPRPARRGPGSATVGVTVALGLFVVAGTLVAQRAGWLDRPTLATAGALIVLILGVAIIVSGLRGRTSGVLGLLAVVAMVIALPVTAVARSDRNGWNLGPDAIRAGSGTTRVTDRDAAADGIQVGLGDAVVDLTDLPMEPDRLTVPISFGAGDLTILVPDDARVSARVDVGAGAVTWRVDGDHESYSGLGITGQYFGVPQDETPSAQLHLRVNIGAGDVTIEEGN